MQQSYDELSNKHTLLQQAIVALSEFKTERMKERNRGCGYVAQSNHAISGHKKGCRIQKEETGVFGYYLNVVS
jgi:hypothetical protein